MSNCFNLLCPNCGSGDDLWVSGTIHTEANLTADGADWDGGDFEWEDDDAAGCSNCGWGGTAGELVDGGEDEGEDEDEDDE